VPEENVPAEEKVRRSVGRIFRSVVGAVVAVAVLVGWGSFGVYTLQPGQAAVLLLLGAHHDTVAEEGLKFTWPPPIVTREIVDVVSVRNEDFGFRGRESDATDPGKLLEATMQTSDNNIVRVGFSVQYSIKDAFAARYRVADSRAVVRDAAQAAMREAVGRETVDGVLRERRAAVTAEVESVLQEVLDGYEAGIAVGRVLLQDVQAPEPVRAAFEDVVAATQDGSRLVNEAEGYRNEVIPKARAEATELVEAAYADRDARVAEATGEAARFSAVALEYGRAPEVTAKRLYLETMELVFPEVEKVIIEPGTASVLPYLPLGRDGARR
jgi:membrane protease subunit HflK